MTNQYTHEINGSDVKHDMRQAEMKMDTRGYEIVSSKHLVGKCVINGRHNKVKRFRRVTISKDIITRSANQP